MSAQDIKSTNPLLAAYSVLGPGRYAVSGFSTPPALPLGLMLADGVDTDFMVADMSRGEDPTAAVLRAKDQGVGAVLMVTESGEARDRAERAAYEAGYRKHPLYHSLAPYEMADAGEGPFASLLEPVPALAVEKWPLSRLLPERTLHMDMMREPGRRSDAHTARYAFAAGYVKAGDHVLDVACGYGYGSHMLAGMTGAGRILGVDLSEQSVSYASLNYGSERVRFEAGDAQNLTTVADSSIDVIVSFETIEHVPDPERLLSEFRRVLRPGGRLIGSVPNLWVDGSGRDPNPNHVNVYSHDRLAADVGRHLLIDEMFGQTAGGNALRLPDEPRLIAPIGRMKDCEWVIVTAFKDPLSDGGTYEERHHVVSGGDLPLALDFARIHENPWLGHGLVSTFGRPRGRDRLVDLAGRVAARSTPGGQDAMAAACVLGYAVLAKGERQAAEEWDASVERLLRVDADRTTPSWLRWSVSLTFLRGRLAEIRGRTDLAIAHYMAVCAADCGIYHPSLLTKKADAGHRGARLAMAEGDAEFSAAFLRLVVDAGRAMLEAGSQAVTSLDHDDPGFPFHWIEASQVLRLSAMAAESLKALSVGGLAAFRRSLAEDVPTLNDVHAQREISRLRNALSVHERRIARIKRLVPAPLIRIVRSLLKA